MSKQTTTDIVMIRPKHFGFNAETAVNNVFQKQDDSLSAEEISRHALAEFDALVSRLRKFGVTILVVEDSDSPVKPDAAFPNNWLSTHPDGALITYPMFSALRRRERREFIVEEIARHYAIDRRYSLEHYEDEGKYLEGTGSLVIDHASSVVYACISERTDLDLVDKFCILRRLDKVTFHGEAEGIPIYHTNVMMALGPGVAVVCLDCVPDPEEREALAAKLRETGKEIVEISLAQMYDFAGNMLFLQSVDGTTLCVMSTRAKSALDDAQTGVLERYSTVVDSPLEIIENYGGGSARCMIAENFLRRK